MTVKGENADLLAELNDALLSVKQTNPYLETKLYEKYFSPSAGRFFLSEAESAYIRETGAVTVGVLDNRPPFQYVEREDGEPEGISIDVLDYISRETGLRFDFVSASSVEQLDAMAAAGEIDVMAGLLYDYTIAQNRRLAMTHPYVLSQNILLTNGKSDGESIEGKRCAVVKSVAYEEEPSSRMVFYDTIEESIYAVNAGEADYTYVDVYTAQYFINIPVFSNLKLIPQVYKARQVSFGVVKTGRRELFSILNKAVITLPAEQLQSIINKNTIRRQPFTPGSFIRMNSVEIVCVIVSVSFIIVGLLLFILYQRIKSGKKTSLELEKHLRLYALVNDYFFEYNCKTDTMMVSIPPEREGDRVTFQRYDFSSSKGNHSVSQEGKSFSDFIRTHADGITELRLLCIDGVTHWLSVAMETVCDNSKKPVYKIGRIKIIDEEKEAQNALLDKAQRDSLTHVLNAETSHRLIAKEISRLEQGKNGGLLVIDIDHFKQINDTYGHLSGDKALVDVAGMLKANFREDDIIGRPGGDEFVVYMKNAGDIQCLSVKCSVLCRCMQALSVKDGRGITVSVGAVLSSAGDTYEQLYQQADSALYSAKKLGRNRFQIAEKVEV